MLDKSKKRHKDYKRIITMKTLDTSIYREGFPYLVKFNGDEKGKGIDYYGDGKVGICIEASGGNLTFVFVSGTYVHEEYNTKVVSISCEYLDNSKIEIIPYWSDTDVLKLIDSVKHDPDKFHGYSYWNEEVEIYDQDNIEKEKLNENFRITIDGEVYPLLIPKCDKDEQYEFNMDALQILEDKDLTCLLHIKRKHLDKWKTYGDFKIKVLHKPDGFQMFHTLETDDKIMELKDTWFPGDILSNVKGIQIETSTLVKDDAEDADIEVVDVSDLNAITLGFDGASEEITKDDTEPDMTKFYIDDWGKIIDPNVSTKYPLFVRDEHSNDCWIINHDVLCKALYRKDVIFDISFKMKDCRARACCSCNAKDVQVHVGGSVLTGKIPGKKDAYIHDAAIEFRASDWKEMDSANVNLRMK
ncbi:MAG: hypothetical protein IKU29_04115 [Parabacteroides sp.]|nr:hypothetical protein [Parabacteroides sp.]